MRPPACSKAASAWKAPSPAVDSTRISKPRFDSAATASGMRATRRSPGTISFGTAIFMGLHSRAWAARIADDRRWEKGCAASPDSFAPADRNLAPASGGFGRLHGRAERQRRRPVCRSRRHAGSRAELPERRLDRAHEHLEVRYQVPVGVEAPAQPSRVAEEHDAEPEIVRQRDLTV